MELGNTADNAGGAELLKDGSNAESMMMLNKLMPTK
jgi:hypothetical protein